jgi:hypothetical protein
LSPTRCTRPVDREVEATLDRPYPGSATRIERRTDHDVHVVVQFTEPQSADVSGTVRSVSHGRLRSPVGRDATASP